MTAIAPRFDLQGFLEGRFTIEPSFPVSLLSQFGASEWDFYEEDNIRQSAIPRWRLRITWDRPVGGVAGDEGKAREPRLPPEMEHEVRILAFLALKANGVFVRMSTAPKPQSIAVGINVLLRFLTFLCDGRRIVTGDGNSFVWSLRSLGDISVEDLRFTLKEYPFVDGNQLRKTLKWLASPAMARYLARPLTWNTADIKTLDFRDPQTRGDLRREMPNDHFRLLSDTASKNVAIFLNGLGIERSDRITKIAEGDRLFGIEDSAAAFEDYLGARLADRTARHETRMSLPFSPLRAHFVKKHGISVSYVQNVIDRIQRASFMIVGLYTGGRYSDLTIFKDGCVEKIRDSWVLRGTEVKRSGKNMPENVDLWPAIPVMRDAIKCLKEISKIRCNPYFIAATKTINIGKTPRPMSENGFSEGLNLYLREIDTTQRWKDWKLNPHQLRHTIAHQLARADVGLLYISHHLKHLHSALNTLPSGTTLMYGNIGELAFVRAQHAGDARVEAAQALYDPESPVAGGGAEEFRKRRKAYFEGMAAAGRTKEEVLKELARHSIPFASVGLGYCGGRREILKKDGTKEVPPCLGSLQCQPKLCKQAIITKAHAPHWQRVLVQNTEFAKDERLVHARDLHLKAAADAAEVLTDLGFEVR